MVKTQLFFVHDTATPSGPGPAHYHGFTITLRHHIRQDSSGRVSSPAHRRTPDKTQHLQETDLHAPGGIRTRNPRKRSVADPNLRSRLQLLFEKFHVQAASRVPQSF
jgi:hypothetical protein